MVKYVDILVSFQEIPDEISLCINISNCPCHCKGCHSAYLAEDIGTELTIEELQKLILKNEGITCICLMGGDSNPKEIEELAMILQYQSWYPLKVAWYSGKQELPKDFAYWYFDYIKVGPYIEELGPLNSPTTNQIMYEIVDDKFINITHKFWRNAVESSL